MFITDYLNQQISARLNGDASRFDELWGLIPDFAAQLRRFDAPGSWLHWQARTYDGWYCLPAATGFVVYFQERGRQEQLQHFADEHAAIRFAIEAALITLD